MSVHGEYARALNSVLEGLSGWEDRAQAAWSQAFLEARVTEERDLSTAARTALSVLDRFEAALRAPTADARADGIPDRMGLSASSPLRDACHRLRAHCHAIVGGRPEDR
jgi:hypothetical protein